MQQLSILSWTNGENLSALSSKLQLQSAHGKSEGKLIFFLFILCSHFEQKFGTRGTKLWQCFQNFKLPVQRQFGGKISDRKNVTFSFIFSLSTKTFRLLSRKLWHVCQNCILGVDTFF